MDIFHLTGETAREYLLHPVNLSDLKEMTSNQFDQMMKEQAVRFFFEFCSIKMSF